MPVQQILLRNEKKGVTVLTPNPEKPETYLRFEAAGDEMGGDALYVSRATAELPATIQAVRKGLLVAEVPESDELFSVMRVQASAQAAAEKPLTAESFVWDDEGNATSKPIAVTIAPLMKE